MPKININGITREMTDEEIREMEARTAEIPAEPKSKMERRIEELEEALEVLLGGIT